MIILTQVFFSFRLTYDCQVHPRRPCLGGLEVHSAPVKAIIGLTDVEHLQPGPLGAGVGVKNHSVVSKQIRVYPMWTHIIGRRHARVDAVDGALHILPVPHDKHQLVIDRSGLSAVGRAVGYRDVAWKKGGVARLVDQTALRYAASLLLLFRLACNFE